MKISTREMVESVTERWIYQGRVSTYEDIAKGVGCSASTARRRFEETEVVGPEELTATWADIERYAKNYGTFLGYKRARAWKPSDKHLRSMIHRLRIDKTALEAMLKVETDRAARRGEG